MKPTFNEFIESLRNGPRLGEVERRECVQDIFKEELAAIDPKKVDDIWYAAWSIADKENPADEDIEECLIFAVILELLVN